MKRENRNAFCQHLYIHSNQKVVSVTKPKYLTYKLCNLFNRKGSPKANSISDRKHFYFLSKTLAQRKFKPFFLPARASVTVEAALTAPVFFLFLLSFCWILHFLLLQNENQSLLFHAAQEYVITGKKEIGIAQGMSHHRILRWKEGEIPVYALDYVLTIPFCQLPVCRFHFYQQMPCHDYQGCSMCDNRPIQSQQMVYLTENASVYHCNRFCTYIHPEVQEIPAERISQKRNLSGGKYYPCRHCCNHALLQGTGTLFITSYGTCYHRKRDCSDIMHEVRSVSIREVGSLPPCSKCGKR